MCVMLFQGVLPPEHEPQSESPPTGGNTQSSNNSSLSSGNEGKYVILPLLP